MSPRILFVEDDPDDRELAMMQLRRFGLKDEILPVRDGAEALDWLEAHKGELPDLILSDLKMPRMNALEMLERLGRHPVWRSIPVVLFTSSGNPNDRDEALRLGARVVLTKPDQLDGYRTLADTLRSLLGATLK